jgi:hypothetical protein
MIPPIDVASLSGPAQRLVSPSAPQKIQEVTARGVAPGLKPGEIVIVLVLLSSSDRPTVKETADRTLAALPEVVLAGALASDLPPMALDVLAHHYGERIDILEKLVSSPNLDGETIEHLARVASETAAELIATNEERLLARPRIIELLYMNKNTRMSTADRLIELAVRHKLELAGIPAWREASLAIQHQLLPEPTPEPMPADVEFKKTQELAEALASEQVEDTHVEVEDGTEELKKKFVPLYRRVAEMSVTEKIRAAMLGTREERSLLVRDHNRLVARAVVTSPTLQEDEVVLFSRNKNLSDEVLRVIGSTPEWVKSYTVKKHLVENPKTPVMVSTRLVQHLREADLRRIAKSKNVTGPVKDAARRHLERRNR